MKLHLKQIPVEGLQIEGEESAEILDLDAADIRPVGPIRYVFDVGISGTGLFATGTLALDVEMQCGSCLEKFLYPAHVNNFAMQTELTGAETVDLTPFIREDTLLALPPYPRCDWNGKKVCNGPPVNPTVEEAAPAAATDWAALEKLNIR